MKPMTIDEFKKLRQDCYYRDMFTLNRDQMDRIEKALQTSDNCQALLKKWGKVHKELPPGCPNMVRYELEECIRDLKKAIRSRK